MTILDQIVARKREEVAERERAAGRNVKSQCAARVARGFAEHLRPLIEEDVICSATSIRAIAEIKRRSPSRGVLRENLDPAALALAYERSGAAALSVLTDREFFGGSDDDLIAAQRDTLIPVLRKDFTIDPYQIYEARSMGVDAVLLIVRILDDAQLRDFLALAQELSLDALVETHDAREIDRAQSAGARIIGVNARDLATFETKIESVIDLKRHIPPECISVAESGISTRADVRKLEKSGFDAILVGETLVRAADPGAKLRELLGTAP